LFGCQQICGIAVCVLCSVKFGAEEGIFHCAKHGPSMTGSSMPVAPVVALHPETAKKPPQCPGGASKNVKSKSKVLIDVGSRRTSPCFASVGTTLGPSDAFWGGVTPQNLKLGLTPPTTEGLRSTIESNETNILEGTEIAVDDFKQTTEEWSTTSSSSFSNNDDAQSSSASNDAAQSSSASNNDAAQSCTPNNDVGQLLASSTKDATSFHTVLEKLLDKCSYRKCMDKSNQRDLVTCASANCNKKFIASALAIMSHPILIFQ
jgi:hypothetical protein